MGNQLNKFIMGLALSFLIAAPANAYTDLHANPNTNYRLQPGEGPVGCRRQESCLHQVRLPYRCGRTVGSVAVPSRISAAMSRL